MGLDSVELIMLWEQAFAVHLDQSDVANVRTPHDAIDILVLRLDASDHHAGACLSTLAFNRLRKGLVQGACVARARVRPGARLRDLLPPAGRRSRWKAALRSAGLPATGSLTWGTDLLIRPTTIAEAVQWIVASMPKMLKDPDETWTRCEIRTVIRAAILEVLGVTKFSDDSDFVRDLGMD